MKVVHQASHNEGWFRAQQEQGIFDLPIAKSNALNKRRFRTYGEENLSDEVRQNRSDRRPRVVPLDLYTGSDNKSIKLSTFSFYPFSGTRHLHAAIWSPSALWNFLTIQVIHVLFKRIRCPINYSFKSQHDIKAVLA